jgi:hypothetical protein
VASFKDSWVINFREKILERYDEILIYNVLHLVHFLDVGYFVSGLCLIPLLLQRRNLESKGSERNRNITLKYLMQCEGGRYWITELYTIYAACPLVGLCSSSCLELWQGWKIRVIILNGDYFTLINCRRR